MTKALGKATRTVRKPRTSQSVAAAPASPTFYLVEQEEGAHGHGAAHASPTPLGFWHWSGKVYGERSQDWLDVQSQGGNVNLALLLYHLDLLRIPVDLTDLQPALVQTEAVLLPWRTLRQQAKSRVGAEEYQTMLGENGLGPANSSYVSALGDDKFATTMIETAAASKLTPAAPGWAILPAGPTNAPASRSLLISIRIASWSPTCTR